MNIALKTFWPERSTSVAPHTARNTATRPEVESAADSISSLGAALKASGSVISAIAHDTMGGTRTCGQTAFLDYPAASPDTARACALAAVLAARFYRTFRTRKSGLPQLLAALS